MFWVCSWHFACNNWSWLFCLNSRMDNLHSTLEEVQNTQQELLTSHCTAHTSHVEQVGPFLFFLQPCWVQHSLRCSSMAHQWGCTFSECMGFVLLTDVEFYFRNARMQQKRHHLQIRPSSTISLVMWSGFPWFPQKLMSSSTSLIMWSGYPRFPQKLL